jgi:hypothetical protein
LAANDIAGAEMPTQRRDPRNGRANIFCFALIETLRLEKSHGQIPKRIAVDQAAQIPERHFSSVSSFIAARDRPGSKKEFDDLSRIHAPQHH